MNKKRTAIYSLSLIPAFIFAIMGVWWLSALSLVVLLVIFVAKSNNRYLAGFRQRKWLLWPIVFLGIIIAAILFRTLFLCIYEIPSSSMERTIMKDDVVWGSKFTYGPKLPKNPYEIPWFNLLYWITHRGQKNDDIPHWDYRRLKGFGKMNRGDVMAFEHPDKGEIYIKRCVALPGDTFSLINGKVSNDNHILHRPDGALFYSKITFSSKKEMNKFLNPIREDNFRRNIRENDSLSFSAIHSHQEMKDYRKMKEVEKVEIDTSWYKYYGTVYPHNNPTWDWGNMGPLWIPKKGATIELDSTTYLRYADVMNKHENIKIEKTDAGYKINGKVVRQYTFKNDYCFMLGDNRYDSQDSRYFGFVPLKNIIAKASFVIYSKEDGFSAARKIN
jgi:signal peptidase I